MMDSLYNALVSCGFGGLAAWLVTSHQKRLDKRDEEERKKLAEALGKLQEEQIQEIKIAITTIRAEFAKHVKDDKTPEMLNELKHIAAAVNRMANQSAQQLENDKKQDVTLATIIAKQGNMELFLNNLNELVVKHISPNNAGEADSKIARLRDCEIARY